jgi:flagellin
MSLVINNNLMAMTATRNLSNAYGNLATSVNRLSSGLRITTAADDAAGLAIRELMRADIASLNQGVRNANDAISMIQTADGALGVIDEKLIRMKELATQAATGTYASDQRLIIDSEYQAMASEITRIANATDFNGIYLLNGNLSATTANIAVANWNLDHSGSGLKSTGPLKIHFGTGNDSAEDYYYIAIGNSTASALGVGISADTGRANGTHGVNGAGASISTQQGAQEALAALNAAITSKDNIRANLGALQNRLENTITNLQIQAENLQAAESRISDADIAVEMTRFVRNQILTQSAVAMLSQANTLPQMALQLMQG